MYQIIVTEVIEQVDLFKNAFFKKYPWNAQ